MTLLNIAAIGTGSKSDAYLRAALNLAFDVLEAIDSFARTGVQQVLQHGCNNSPAVLAAG